jgi:hypothetical protein
MFPVPQLSGNYHGEFAHNFLALWILHRSAVMQGSEGHTPASRGHLGMFRHEALRAIALAG